MNRKQMVKVGISILASLILVMTNFAGLVPGKTVKAETHLQSSSGSVDLSLPNETYIVDCYIDHINVNESGIILNLDGNTINRVDMAPGSSVTIQGGGTISGLVDVPYSNNRLTFSNVTIEEIHYKDGRVEQNGGTVNKVEMNSFYPGVYTLNDGTINGGFLLPEGTLIMNGGTINSGTYSGEDFGVKVQGGTTFSQSGGKVDGNVIVNGGTFNQSGGNVTGTVTVQHGGPYNQTAPVVPAPSNTNPATTATDEPSSETPASNPEADYLEQLTTTIEEAIALGGQRTIYWNEGTALPSTVMKLLKENPQITLIFNYTYMNKDYSVALPGSKVEVDPEIPWYGPLYLYGKYGSLKANGVSTQTTSGR